MVRSVIEVKNSCVVNSHSQNGTLHPGNTSSDDSFSLPSEGSGTPSPGNSNLLKSIRFKNVGRLIVASININSIANKFDSLEEIVKDSVDILMILETKIDNTFPKTNFQ